MPAVALGYLKVHVCYAATIAAIMTLALTTMRAWVGVWTTWYHSGGSLQVFVWRMCAGLEYQELLHARLLGVFLNW